MPLSAGQRLGAYEILSAIGKGGMGEVYRARDTKLQRDVAIKVLPESLATDRDRLARFEREAQLLAALNHQHIAGIYGVDTTGDTMFLVLELVEGDTLADRISRGGALSVSEAIAIARQIADALQAAHDKGIIHRDLKPGNIALTADNQVKVLDFGLAKAIEVVPAASSSVPAATMSPTLSVAMTEAGFILGTAGYMSPEQAKGRPADKRSDVWAFGCVLFEMLTGKRAFDGEDATDVLAAIVRGEPDWQSLPADTPAYLRRILAGCLARDRKQRFADIAVVSHLLSEPTPVAGTATAATVTPRRALVFVAVQVALLAASATLTWWFVRSGDSARPVMRLSMAPRELQVMTGATGSGDRQAALSPDGSRLVFVVSPGQLAVRNLETGVDELLAGTSGGRTPFWSPDGQWIGFTSSALELRKIPSTGGGTTVIVRPASPPRGVSWSADGNILFATTDTLTGLATVAASGGTPRVLTTPDRAREEVDHVYPSVLPGGRAALFTVLTGGNSTESAQIAVLDLQTNKYKVVIAGGKNAEYLEPGYLIYAAAGALRAVRFDLDRLETVGESVPVVDDVMVPGGGAAQYSVSRTGHLVYTQGSADAVNARALVWVDRAGHETPVAGVPLRAYQYPRLSHDNTRVAVSIADQEQDIYILHLARQTLTRMTFGPSVEIQPTWFPDDERVVYSSTRPGPANLYAQRADGTGPLVRLTESSANQLTVTLTPDATGAVLTQQNGGSGNDLMKVRLGAALADVDTGRGATGQVIERKLKAEPLIQTTYNEAQPELSPDGRYLAYMSMDSGKQQIIVQPFPDLNGRWQISSEGGTRVAWNPNGKELFYAAPGGAIMSVPVQVAPTFSFGNPVKLFDWPTIGTPGLARTYDVSRDGHRFLMIKEAHEQRGAAATISVIVNFVEELKKKLPVAK